MLDVLVNRNEKESPAGEEVRISDRADKPVKSALKAISWRIVGTIDTMIISYLITGKLTVAFSIGSVEVITKTILYYFHERVWAHIHGIKIKGINRKNEKRIGIKSIEQPA
ncbi:MAG: DUF2061 domain-containing protein [Bacteroidales bacterium]